MTLREVIRKVFNKTINEKMTKEQQDAGREAMERIYLKPMFQLVDWFNNYWKNKSKTVEYFKQKERLTELKSFFRKHKKFSDKDVNKYVSSNIGSKPELPSLKPWDLFDDYNEWQNAIRQPSKNEHPYMTNTLDTGTNKSGGRKLNGFYFETRDSDVARIIRKFIIMHEYGHLYEYMKNYVKTGEKQLIDTVSSSSEERQNSEGKANAYAFDNMYIRDFEKLTKHSNIKDDDFLKRLKLKEKETQIEKDYKEGTKKHSKRLGGKSNEE